MRGSDGCQQMITAGERQGAKGLGTSDIIKPWGEDMNLRATVAKTARSGPRDNHRNAVS